VVFEHGGPVGRHGAFEEGEAGGPGALGEVEARPAEGVEAAAHAGGLAAVVEADAGIDQHEAVALGLDQQAVADEPAAPERGQARAVDEAPEGGAKRGTV
jgi:uncharacterized membrane-anchored protein